MKKSLSNPDQVTDIFESQRIRSQQVRRSYAVRANRGRKGTCTKCGGQKVVTNPKTGGMMPCPFCKNKKVEVKL